MNTAVYIRVSTTSQNLDSQQAYIQTWLTAQGIEDVTWFIDTETGGNLNRDGFKDLEKAIFNGEVNTVVVYKLDRLARTLKEGINVICEWCDKSVRLVSVTQHIDLSGTIGKMIAGLLFGVAEIELENIRERQAMGIAHAKTKGVYTGRKANTTKAKPERAKELKEKGLKVPEIAQALGVSRRTAYNYLR